MDVLRGAFLLQRREMTDGRTIMNDALQEFSTHTQTVSVSDTFSPDATMLGTEKCTAINWSGNSERIIGFLLQ